MGGVLVVERWVRGRGWGRSDRRDVWRGAGVLLAGVGLLTAAALTRTVGAVWWWGIVAVAVVGLTGRGGRRGAAGERGRAWVAAGVVGLAVAVAVGGWLWRERAADAQKARTQLAILAEATETEGWVERVAGEALVRVRNVGQLLVPGMLRSGSEGVGDVNLLVFVPVTLGVGYGWWRQGRAVAASRGPGLTGADSGMGVLAWGGGAAVLLLVVAWPHGGGVRYLLPLLPVLWLGLYRALPGHWATAGGREHLMGVVLCLHLAAALVYQQAERAEARALHARWPGLAAVAGPVRGHERADYFMVELDDDTKWPVRLLLDRHVRNSPLETLAGLVTAPPPALRVPARSTCRFPTVGRSRPVGGGLRRIVPDTRHGGLPAHDFTRRRRFHTRTGGDR